MDSSSFNTLSAELRNRIWELALSHGGLAIYRTKALDDITTLREATKDLWDLEEEQPALALKQSCEGFPIHANALLETCRSIRAEASQLFYANNTFVAFLPKPTDLDIMFDFHAAVGDTNNLAVRVMVAKPMEDIKTNPFLETYLNLGIIARDAHSIKSDYSDMIPFYGEEMKGESMGFSDLDWKTSFQQAMAEFDQRYATARANRRDAESTVMICVRMYLVIMRDEYTPYFAPAGSVSRFERVPTLTSEMAHELYHGYPISEPRSRI